MKRIGNLFEQICSLDNLRLADSKARRGKSWQYGVQVHNKNQEDNILKLHAVLLNQTYKTSEYSIFKVYEPKEREVYRLPYYPDRILHHAIMNVLEPIFVNNFTRDTYSCIKGRGIHAAARRLRKALRNADQTRYCLKLDIKKFYPNIDHAILKRLLRRKFKDPDLLKLLDGIIDSAKGVPIGNYLSQYFANFYLSYFDHWLKEVKEIKHYFRYADDLVILAGTKEELHRILKEIRDYMQDNLNLEIKNNYQIFSVDIRGIDFLGYRFFRGYTLLRKRIKKNFARKLAKGISLASIASYRGWTKHCNSKHLLKKLFNKTT